MIKRIKNSYILILLTVLVFSCTTTDLNSENDGLSFETAIITKSVGFEYDWIAKNYPGSKVQSQSLVIQDDIPFDIISIKTKSGESISIYFDISELYSDIF